MADEINVGSVSVEVVPDAGGFNRKLKAQVEPEARRLGERVARFISDRIAPAIRKGLTEGFAGSEAGARRQGTKAGDGFGGSFARSAKTRIKAALSSLPEAQIGVATSEADQELKDLRAEIAALSDKTIGIDISDREALAEMSRLEERLTVIGARSPHIQIQVDTARASAELAAFRLEMTALDTSSSTVKAGGGAASGIASAGPATVATLAVIAGALPIIATGILALPSLIAAVAAPLGAIALGFDGIKNAAAGLAAPFKSLQGMVSGVFEQTLTPSLTKLNALMPTLRAGFSGIALALSGLVSGVIDKLTSGSGISAISATFANLGTAFSALGPAMGPLVDSFLILLREGSAAFARFAPELATLIIKFNEILTYLSASGTLTRAFNELNFLLGNLIAVIGFFIVAGVAITALFARLNELMARSAQAAAAFANTVSSFFGSLPGRIGAALSGLGGMVASAFSAAFAAGRSAVSGGASRVLGVIEGIPGRAKSALGGLTATMFDAGQNAVQGLIDGILSKLGAVGSAVGAIAGKVKSGISGALGGVHIPGFANGTNFAPGGLAVVGENGPELVHLPRGSRVDPKLPKGGAGPSTSAASWTPRDIRRALDGATLIINGQSARLQIAGA